MQRLSDPPSDYVISDYKPMESSSIVPAIKGTVLADSIKPYRYKRRLNAVQKLWLYTMSFLAVFVGAVIFLPLVFSIMLLVCTYVFIFTVSKGSFTTGSPGGGGCAKSIPGTSIIPRT